MKTKTKGQRTRTIKRTDERGKRKVERGTTEEEDRGKRKRNNKRQRNRQERDR